MIKPTPYKRALFFITIDIFLSLGTLFLAYNLRFNFSVDESYLGNFLHVFILLTTFKITLMCFLKIYNVSWRFFSLHELKKIIYAHIFAYPMMVMVYYAMPQFFTPFPRSVLIIDLFLSMMFLGFFRILKRLIIENDTNVNLKKTLLVGANSFSQSIIKERSKYYVSCVVDEDENLVGSYFSNMKVAPFDAIKQLVESMKIDAVIIAKSYDTAELNFIYDQLKDTNIADIKLVTLQDKEKTLKSLSIEDLLAREPKDLDKEQIAGFIKDKTVLVTGAGGSIGSEICRQCEKYGAKKLIMLDNSEYNLYSINEELGNIERVTLMQNILDLESLEKSFVAHMPQIVIHAAAYKHVPLVEANIEQAIKNNIIGTKNVIDTAIKFSVQKVVMISTDKAVRPTNVMGTTKRVCELYAQNVVSSNDTEIVAVRFGNVLGSSGSVIPKFKAQIDAGGPVTVTDPEITRYFMLIPEACELVLQAASIGQGGEIFILDMGEPVKIVDLAKKMIELSSKEDIKIEFTGLRPGEKLYEELLIDESSASTKYDSITVAESTKYDIEKLNKDIEELLVCDDKVQKLKEIVPEFTHKLNSEQG